MRMVAFLPLNVHTAAGGYVHLDGLGICEGHIFQFRTEERPWPLALGHWFLPLALAQGFLCTQALGIVGFLQGATEWKKFHHASLGLNCISTSLRSQKASMLRLLGSKSRMNSRDTMQSSIAELVSSVSNEKVRNLIHRKTRLPCSLKSRICAPRFAQSEKTASSSLAPDGPCSAILRVTTSFSLSADQNLLNVAKLL